MNPRLVLWVLIAFGALWTTVWAFVLLRSRSGPAFEVIEPAENRLRLRLLFTFGLILLVTFALSLRAYPYSSFRTRARSTIPSVGTSACEGASRPSAAASQP